MSTEHADLILVTGVAGFIGFHLARRLCREGRQVIGIDNLNTYYDVRLKRDRLAVLETSSYFEFVELDLANRPGVADLFARYPFARVVNLAAQAGVRYSLENPQSYIDSNLVGFVNLLEGCRQGRTPHLVFASSSSVYGLNTKMPFSVKDNVDHPISLYAATKKANELMAHAYSYLFNLPCTGLRFFTVYGPWGRPDMALFLFTKAILDHKPIKVFNHGRMERDFTYIDDIVEGVVRVMDLIPERNASWSGDAPDPASSPAPYRLYNIGNNRPVKLMEFIRAVETALGQSAIKEFLPMQPGDVPATYADIEELEDAVGFRPRVGIEEGVRRFTEWYRDYYQQ
jgi:UDP-glucuronate 4-epimerase